MSKDATRRDSSAGAETSGQSPGADLPSDAVMSQVVEGLSTWLEVHPTAMVGAVSSAGGPVEMPSTIPLGPGHQTDQRSLLELVVPEDSKLVTDAFVSALNRGVGVARVRMASDPSRPMLLQYLNVQSEHGVLLRTLVPTEEIEESREAMSVSALTRTRPRLGVMTKSEVAMITSLDAACTLMLGWNEADMVGHQTLEFIHPDDHVRAIDNWMSRLSRSHASLAQTVRLRYLCKDGEWLWLETSNEFQDQGDGTSVVVTQLIDVSEEMAAVEAMQKSERFLRRLADTVPVGLFQISEGGAVTFVNPVLEALISHRKVGSIADLADALAPSHGDELVSAIDRAIAEGVDSDLDVSLAVLEDGSRWSYRVTLRAVTDGHQVQGALGCVVDVTELRTLADTDVLTGLRNRRWIMEVLATEVVNHAGRVSTIFVDLDDFKSVNDRFGHHVGDEVLVEVSARLRSTLRPSDRIGRIGGDEFLVVCPGLSNAKTALAVAKRLQNSLHREFALPEVTIKVTASFGVACGRAGISVDELVSSADAAMYEAKATPAGPPVCFGGDG